MQQPDLKPLERLVQPFHGDALLLQSFGENSRMYAPYGLKGHNGLDYGLWTGTAVLAMASGVVRFAGDGVEEVLMGSAAGTCIMLQHGGALTGYAHLSGVFVSAGDWVEAGDVIALSGATGAATGDHLHVELIPQPLALGNGFMGRTDPLPLMRGAS